MVVAKDKDKEKDKKKGGKPGKEEKTIDESFDTIKVDAKSISTAILMLDSPEEEILQKACESIFRYAEKSDNNRLSVHQLNATMKLFKLIGHEDRVVQRNATMAFGVLSSNTEVRKFLREENNVCIEKMITLLTAEYDPLVNEYAAMWLKNICEEYSTKCIVIASEGALASLIQLLSASDPDIIFNALGAIDKLMADHQPRQSIRELKGIEPIFNLMKSDYPQIQELVFNALGKITQDVENREVIRDFGGLEKLVDFLGCSEFKEMHVHCLNVLANCLEDTQCLDIIQQTGGLNKILAYCQEVSDSTQLPQINATAAKALARCAKKQENRKILNEQQAEKTLIYLLLGDNDDVKVAACQAISAMAESVTSRDTIRNYEGIETLIRLCSNDNPKIREMAMLALSNLTLKNHNNCREILTHQGIESIVKLLKDDKDTTKAYACVCLTNMSTDELLRQEIGQQLFVPCLCVALCARNSFTQAKACLAVASFAVDSNIRNELKTSGAIQTVVQLIQSNNDEVRSNACWAITCAAVDQSIASEFCKYGAIEMLRDINQSSKRKSSYTEAALNKLLESNLAAKYALTNVLEPTNYIFDGFYDMGPMRPNGKFYTLDELVQLPINDKRPILLINAPDEKPQTPDPKADVSKVKTKSGGKSKEKETKGSTVERLGSGKGKRAETAKKHSEEQKSPVNVHVEEKDKLVRGVSSLGAYSKLPLDKDLCFYVDESRDLYKAKTLIEQATGLASYVASRLGGSVAPDDVVNLSYELPINEIKYEFKSNVVPLGRIRVGTYYHRALLYKVLADRLGLKVSLHRGDYNRAWNVVSLRDNPALPPKLYIPDLMHEPGRLMPITSTQAIQYTKLT